MALLGAAWFAPAALAIPPNDSYPLATSSPWRVPINTTYFGRDTSDASVQPGEPRTCVTPTATRTMTNTVWFRLKNVAGPLRISTADDFTNFDTIVAVYEATPDGRPGAFVDCDDDGGDIGFTSDLDVQTVAGREYMVQIGGCDNCSGDPTDEYGNYSITFLGNNSRFTPEELTPGQTGTRSNWFATVSPGEVQSCRGHAYGATVWFLFRSPAKGTATFIASGADTVVSVYRGDGSPPPAACSGEPTPGTLGSRVTLDVEEGSYLMQVGGRLSGGSPERDTTINVSVEYDRDTDVDGDDSPIGVDCDDNDGRRAPGKHDIPFNNFDENCDGVDSKDGDGDHENARPWGNDCDDGDHGINPTAREVPGNQIDENCDDRKAPGNLARLSIDLKANRYAAGKLIFGRLRVSPVRRGYKITVKCKGGRARGCKRASLTKRIRRGRSWRSNFTYAKVLRNGARFEVTVVWPGQNRIGVFKRFVVRRGKLRQPICAMVPTDETGRAFRRSCR